MFQTFKRRLSRSFQKAGEILTGSGPTPEKQFRNAVIEGDEDRAIALYTLPPEGSEGDAKALLCCSLSPSTPFRSKKNLLAETPLLLAVRFARERVVRMLLERGGDPALQNKRRETTLHLICSQTDQPIERAALLDLLVHWDSTETQTHTQTQTLPLSVCETDTSQREHSPREKVSIHCVDIDGNAAIHNAAANGLELCVERLVSLGAIISLVNKNNCTCCELADQRDFKELALMLELALVFQPEDAELSDFSAMFRFEYESLPGVLFLDCQSLDDKGMDRFVDRAVETVAACLCREKENVALFRARAEALLNNFNWDVDRLLGEYGQSRDKVLSAAKMNPDAQSPLLVRTGSAATEQAPTTSTETSAPSVESNGENVKASDCEEKEQSDVEIDLGDIALEESLPPTSDSAHTDANTHTNTQFSEEIGECAICGEQMLREVPLSVFLSHAQSPAFDRDRRALSCLSGHTYCASCWTQHLSVHVHEHGAGFLPCCGYKCGEMLDVRWAEALLSEEDAQRLRQHRQRLVVDCARFTPCPRRGCGLFVKVNASPANEQILRAGAGSNAQGNATPVSGATDIAVSASSVLPQSAICACGQCFCVQCALPAHSPCSCAAVAKWRALVTEELGNANISAPDLGRSEKDAEGDGEAATEGASDAKEEDGAANRNEEIANALWVAANTKKCPRCGTAIEKDEGCNHMSCRKCRKEFCWICMQDWSLHSENTGGYFQCNRFVEANSSNNTNDAASAGAELGDLWAEERGNAQAEAMRLRERNRRMARFIHHFTRFQAHSESVQMESRMSRETLRRIENGLTRSRERALRWLQRDRVTPPWASNNEPQRGSETDRETEKEITLLSTPVKAASSEREGEKEPERRPQWRESFAQWSVHGDRQQLLFLTHGFEELLKCRHVLQWSYAHAFFEFQDDSEQFSSRSHRQQRRLEEHRSSFEAMQADLEIVVETLSDVVARRRLRAARAQIVQATCMAKQKRVELETFLLRFAVEKQSWANAPQDSQSRSGNRSRSSTGRRSSQRQRQREFGLRSLRREIDMDELEEVSTAELARLLFEMENASSPAQRLAIQARLAAIMHQQQNIQDAQDALLSAQVAGRRRSVRRISNRRDYEQDTHSNPESAEIADREENERARSQSPSSRTAAAARAAEERDSEDEAPDLLRFIALEENAGELARLSDRRLRAAARRAEEETELNRAILLSLQYNNSAAAAAAAAGEEAASDSNGPAESSSSASEDKIQSLVAMGFTREQSEAALRETAFNVELAANQLLGLDF